MKGLPRPMPAARRVTCGLRQRGATMAMEVVSSTHFKGEILAIVTVGIDLAKSVFAVHGVDESGKPQLVRPEVPRAKLLELIANLPPCLIGMEACSGAHHWAREFSKFDHTVRLWHRSSSRRTA